MGKTNPPPPFFKKEIVLKRKMIMNKSKKENELRELIGFKQKQRSKLSGGGKERKICARRR